MKTILFVLVLSLLFFTPAYGQSNKQGPTEAQRSFDTFMERQKQIEKQGEKFRTREFRLLWAREAFRHGNIEGALKSWIALAEEGDEIAIYVLKLLAPIDD